MKDEPPVPDQLFTCLNYTSGRWVAIRHNDEFGYSNCNPVFQSVMYTHPHTGPVEKCQTCKDWARKMPKPGAPKLSQEP